MSTIGDYIKQERKKAGLTQEEFALRAGLGLRFVRDLRRKNSRFAQGWDFDLSGNWNRGRKL